MISNDDLLKYQCMCVEVVDQKVLEDCNQKNEEEKVKIQPELMRKLRKLEWKKSVTKNDLEYKDRSWKVEEKLEEDIQNFETEMVVIGMDVEALYPSLDKEECSRIVREEVMRISMVWKNLDYLEGVRMVALNRSADYCRRHKLHRILPVRRKRTGTRPGVTGEGPLGATRGDQEQWRFPSVKITEEEKKLLIAEVVSIVTEVMFDSHLYTFGGEVFKQRRGGPIGLGHSHANHGIGCGKHSLATTG